jgi:hypothetical protein
MLSLPQAAEPLIACFSVAFTHPTFQRFVLLAVGAIVAPRQRTVCCILRTLAPLAQGHWSDFHRVLCRRVWSIRPLGKILATLVLQQVPPDQPVRLIADDTAYQHKGKHVWGKGCHHDACRSTETHVVWLWGHKWVVLAVRVALPFTSRAWALPVACALYRPEEQNKAEGRRHKTPAHFARQLLAMLIHWFPQRHFMLLGDGGYASHDLARFCHRHRRHVTLTSRFHGDAVLYGPVAPRKISRKGGRPRIRGPRLPAPAQAVRRSKAYRFTVSWYGGKRRRVELVWGEGNWYKSGHGLVPLRWVHIHDISGTHRDEYLFSTDPTLAPQQMVSLFTGRWDIEVTFQEARAHLGLATPRNWSRQSVLRTVPCLLGCFSLVSLIFARMTADRTPQVPSSPWHHRTHATFADAITAVRRLLWAEVLQQTPEHRAFSKLPAPLRQLVLDRLAAAG